MFTEAVPAPGLGCCECSAETRGAVSFVGTRPALQLSPGPRWLWGRTHPAQQQPSAPPHTSCASPRKTPTGCRVWVLCARNRAKKMGKEGRWSWLLFTAPRVAQGTMAMSMAKAGPLLTTPCLLHKDGSQGGCCRALGTSGERKVLLHTQTWLPRGDKLVTLCGTCPWGGVAGCKPWMLSRNHGMV